MMKTTAFYGLMARAQRRLNAIILAGFAVRGLAYAAVFTGSAVVIARWLGWGQGIYFIVAGSILGAGVYSITGLRRRLDRQGAARWLDRHLSTREAFSAALIGLARDCAGPFDTAVVSRAERICLEKQRINWPLTCLWRKTGLTAVALLYAGLAISFWHPAPAIDPDLGSLLRAGADKPAAVDPRLKGERRRADPLVPREVARNLFPRNEELANQTEQALQDGDTALLMRLIARARADAEAEAAGLMRDEREGRISEQGRREQAALKALASQAVPGLADGAAGRREEQEAAARDGGPDGLGEEGAADSTAGQANANAPRAEGDRAATPVPAGDEVADERATGRSVEQNQDDSPAGASDRPGRGQGYEPDSRPNMDGDTGPDEIFAWDGEGPYIEYILPGGEATVPLAEASAYWWQSAEAALYLQDIPLDYEELVEWYFLALAQEAADESGEEDYDDGQD